MAKRCVILLAVVASGHNDRRAKLVPHLRREGLWNMVSPRESRLLRAKKLPLRDQAYATWRIEAILVLLWALRKIPKMPPPTFFAGKISGKMPLPLEPTADFISAARLRSQAALRKEQERILMVHWRLRDAQLKGRKPPRDVDIEVVQEQHHALNWLVNEFGEEWDEVSTDT